MVTLKLAVLWDIFLHYQWSKSPTFFKDSEWMTWCPTKFYNIAVWQFFDQSCCGRTLKTELSFGVSKDFCDFPFFILSAAFSIDFNCYEQLQERTSPLVFYFYLHWRSFFIVFPRSKKEKWVFSKLSVKWQLLYQTKLTVPSWFCHGMGKKQDTLIILSGHTERNFDRPTQFSLPLYFEQVFLRCFCWEKNLPKMTPGLETFGFLNAA